MGPIGNGKAAHLNPTIKTVGLPWWLRWQRICLQRRRPGFDPWVQKIPWRREWLPTPVSSSILENATDRRAWRATVHEVAVRHD